MNTEMEKIMAMIEEYIDNEIHRRINDKGESKLNFTYSTCMLEMMDNEKCAVRHMSHPKGEDYIIGYTEPIEFRHRTYYEWKKENGDHSLHLYSDHDQTVFALLRHEEDILENEQNEKIIESS